jgi:outer membrane lipoprotein-sorting protein
MKTKTAFILIFLLTAPFVFSQNTNWDKILLDSDLRFIPEVSEFTITIENYVSGTKAQWYELKCYMNGGGKYLAIYTNPNLLLGQGTLRNGNTIYYYVKKVDRMTQIAAERNFEQSTLSQEDILNTMLSTNYAIADGQAVKLESGVQCYRLNLVSNNKNAAYAKINAYIDADTLLPIKREYYSRAGLLCREMVIKEIQTTPSGQVSLINFDFIDRLTAGKTSSVTFSGIAKRESFPSSWFTVNYLRSNVR